MSGEGLSAELKQWWERLSDDQKNRLRSAAVADRREPSDPQLLVEAGCPYGPIGTKVGSEGDYGWTWPESIREFIAGQLPT